MTSSAANEIRAGNRFAFGKNWSVFLREVDEHRICDAEDSLRTMLEVAELRSKRFLDVGSGSGLFSLAARRLGADVHSFDYDAESVACANELKARYFPDDRHWHVERGSVLDQDYLRSLGNFDVVYSWGVLHHTGQMWQALENVCSLVAPGGKLFIAIYNDQGRKTRIWRRIKKTYNRSPRSLRLAFVWGHFSVFWLPKIVLDTVKGHPTASWRNYHRSNRGMSAWTNIVDWVGGYPFEVAKPEQVLDFSRRRGFVLDRLITCAGKLGNNQFVFRLPVATNTFDAL